MRLFVAITIMVCFLLLVILVLNMEEKSKIIKISFILFILAFLLCIFFINEIVMDYFISMVIRLYYFPTFSSIIMILLISMGIFLYNLSNDKLSNKYRIINYIFALLVVIGYIIFMESFIKPSFTDKSLNMWPYEFEKGFNNKKYQEACELINKINWR